MPKPTLEDFFDNLATEVPPKLDRLVDTAAELTEPAGSGKYVALQASQAKLAVSGGAVEIFDQPFTVTGDVTADLLVHGPGDAVPILAFADPESGEPMREEGGCETLTAPADRVLAELRLQAGAEITGDFKPPLKSGLTLTANAAAGGGLTYRHLRPVAPDRTRAEALTEILVTSRLPAFVPLAELRPGEVHILETLIHLDLGVRAQYGTSFDLEKDLTEVFAAFDGMAAEIQAHVALAIDASVGFSFYEHCQIALGRFNTTGAGWVRARLQRLRRNRLTLGAKLALQVQYDLASATFSGLLDRILEIDPTKRLLATLKDLQDLRTKGGWPAVRDKLAAEVGDEVGALVQGADWLEWTGTKNKKEIEALLGKIADAVRAYEELPEKLQSLWSSFLTSVDLGPGSKLVVALTKIAAVDPKSPDAMLEKVLSDEWADARDLLELLSGQSVEDMVLSRAGAVEDLLGRAKVLATQALGFLEGLPEGALGVIRQYAQRTGIDGAVAWLAKNATDLESLQKTAADWIRKLVERLVGKAWGELDEADLQRLADWAGKVQALLEKKEELGERLQSLVERLNGEVGFSFNVELNRLSERYALVDLEIDPSEKRLRETVKRALVRGNARQLVEELPSGGDDADSLRLRDGIFLSRHVRTSALGTFFSLLGLHRREIVRVEEELIRVRQEGETLRRVGSYAGGAVRSLGADPGQGLAQKQELGVWLTLGAEGTGGHLDAGYDHGGFACGLRVTFARDDDKTMPYELRALDEILGQLGFRGTDTRRLEDLPGEPLVTSLALQLRFRDAAVHAVLDSSAEADWNRDSLNAAHRWFDDELLPDAYPPMAKPRLREGRLLAALLETQDFQARWQDSVQFVESDPGDAHVRIEGRPVRLIVTRRTHGQKVCLLTGIQDLLSSRGGSWQALDEARQTFTALGAKPLPADLRETARHFAKAMARTPGHATGWPSVLFNLWLLLARVTRSDPAALDDVQGLAVLRWKRKASDKWTGPLHWRAHGVPVHEGEDSIFPIA